MTDEHGSAVIGKVVAYITRERGGRRELLVFDHSDFPEAGTQVPAGTIEAGEPPDQALWREVREETGQTGYRLVRHLMTYDYTGAPSGQTHRRHVYHLTAPVGLPERWRWGERLGAPDQIIFEFYWLSLDPLPILSGGLGDYLYKLTDED